MLHIQGLVLAPLPYEKVRETDAISRTPAIEELLNMYNIMYYIYIITYTLLI